MKHLLIYCISVFLFTCTDRTFDNPYDAKVSNESWAPQNFQMEVRGSNAIRLSWSQPNNRIEGFVLTKKINGSEQVVVLDAEDRSYEDFEVNSDLQNKRKVEYFLKAKAGESYSSQLRVEGEFPIPPALPTLSSTEFQSITYYSAIGGGYISDDGGSAITAKGICWNTSGNPNLSDHIVSQAVGDGTGTYTLDLTNLQSKTRFYVRAFATNAAGTAYGQQVEFETLDNPNLNQSLQYGSITDVDGNIYATIEIGTQTWMAENLRVTHLNDGTPINKSPVNMLNQTTSPAYSDNDNQEPVQLRDFGYYYNHFSISGLCPNGWHVPSNTEWQDLITFLGGDQIAGAKLASISSSWLNNGAPTNTSGWSAAPAGYIECGTQAATGFYSAWWSSDFGTTPLTCSAGGTASIMYSLYGYTPPASPTFAISSSAVPNEFGLPVRCVKN
jgi:uncharacterized protein (TIGR02145 family)